MAQEGIGAALFVDDSTMNSLKMAQERITSMKITSEELANNFDKVRMSVQGMVTSLSNSNLNVKFNTSGAVESIKGLSDVIGQLSQKSSNAVRDTALSEESLNNKLDAILNKRADSYSAVKQRMSELLKYQEQWSKSSEAATAKGEGAFNGEAYKRAEKYIAALQERLRYFNGEFNKEGAYRSETLAYWMDEKTYTDALAKIQMLKSAQQEFLKPGGDSSNSGVSSWITDHLRYLEEEIDRLTVKLPELKRLENEALVSRRLDTALSMDESTIETTKDKIGQVKAAMLSLMHASEKNEFIDKNKISQASEELERLRKKLESLNNDASIRNSRVELARVLSLDEGSVGMMRDKIEALKSAINSLKKTAGNKLDSSWLSDADKKMDELTLKLKIADKSMDITKKSASQLGEILKSAFSVTLITKFVQNVVKMRGEFEMAEKSIAVIVNDSNKAFSIFNEIQNIAIKSPFQVRDLVKQTKQLAAYRIETDKLVSTTKMLGDISAGVGVDMNRLILAYGQVKAATYLKGTELRQFSEAGVNMLSGLAKRLSELQGRMVTTGEVLQMVSKRMISFEDVDAVLRAQTSAGGTFFKMQEKQAETLQGRISNLKDRVDIMYNEIGKSTQGLMNNILNAFEAILKNYQYLASALTAGLVFKSLTVVFAKLSSIASIVKQLGTFLSFVKADGLFSVLTSLGALGPAVAGVVAAIAAISALIIHANKLRNELKKAAKDTATTTDQQIRDYRKLAKTIEDNNKTIEERQSAFEELKQLYGNILPLEHENIDTIKSSGESYREYAQAIREANNELLREKSLLLVQEDRQKKQEKNIKRIQNALTYSYNHDYSSYGSHKASYLADEDEMLPSAFLEIQEKILDGQIKNTRDAADELYRIMDEYYGKLEGATKAYVESAGNDSVVLRQMKAVFTSLNLMEDIPSKYISDYTVSKAGQSLSKAIKGIKEWREETRKTLKYDDNGVAYEAFVTNPEKLERMVDEQTEQYIKLLRENIENNKDENGNILESLLTTSDKARLNRMLDEQASNLMSPLQKAISDIYVQANDKFKGLKTKFGQGELSQKEGEGLDDYIKRLEEMQKSAKAIEDKWLEDEKSFSSEHIMQATYHQDVMVEALGKTKDEAHELQSAISWVIPFLKAFTSSIKSAKDAAEYKSNVKSFVSEIRKAKSELDSLDKDGNKLYKDKLNEMARKINMSLPDSFDDESIEAWVDKYKKKLESSGIDIIDIKLDIKKDKLQKQIEKFRGEASELWDKYDTAKKFSEWGISLSGYNMTEIYDQIMSIVERLNTIGTEESIKAAKEVKEKANKIRRDEQAEAGKIIYEAQKKALSKTEQAYADMYEKLRIIREQSNPDGTDGIIGDATIKEAELNVIKNGFEEVSKAEWEAFKSTEAYALAFGDLDGASKEVLNALKVRLTGIQSSDSLDPTDMKTVVNAIEKINDELNRGSATGFFNSVKEGFGMIKEAGDIVNKTLPELNEKIRVQSLMVSSAQEAYNSAAKDYEEDASEDNKTNMEVAQASLTASQEGLNELMALEIKYRTKANSLYTKSTKRLSDLTVRYGKVGDAMNSVIDLCKDVMEAFGLMEDDELNAAVEGFQQGFALIGTAISSLIAIMSAMIPVEGAVTAGGYAMQAALWPLLVIGAALGAIVAIIKASDKALENQIESHKEAVEDLKDAYDRLKDSFDKAYDMKKLEAYNDAMIGNLRQQKKELLEAIALNERRKQNSSTKQETDDLKDQLNDIQDKMDEVNNSKLEILGVSTNYQDVAKDWADSWYDAFQSTGDGLSALKDSFNDLYNDIVKGQIQSLVMGPALEKLKTLIERAVDDWVVTEEEANAIKNYRDTELKAVNERATKLAELLGSTDISSDEYDTLEKGIKGVTEQTAQALESILNSTRFYVADNNRILLSLENTLIVGEGDNTILSNLKAQTRHLKALATIADAVFHPGGHPKGAGGIKVFVD